MPYSRDHFHSWFRRNDSIPPVKMSALKTRDRILTSVDFSPASNLVLGFVLKSIISCKPSTANKALESLFKIPEFRALPETHLPLVSLELFWKVFSGRPAGTPWKQWDEARFKQANLNCDPESLTFYAGWTEPNWIQATVEARGSGNDDPQQWSKFQDAWTEAIRARVTCKPQDGTAPSRETLETAFQTINKLFTSIPSRGIENGTVSFWYSREVRKHFILAVYLGHMEAAQNLMKEASKTSWLIDLLFDVPAFYEALSTSVDDPIITFGQDEEMKEAEDMICAALTTRIEAGRKPPLDGVSWTELLKRFSEAAFFVHNENYLDAKITSAKQILQPPLTQDEITKIEEKLGPLPEDIKEMALIADGFYGGWHFAGGGWAGLKDLWKCSADEYETYLGYFPAPKVRIETRARPDGSTYQVRIATREITCAASGNKWGVAYCGFGKGRNDDFEHIICPHPTWKKIQAAKNEEVVEGEYAYLYYAHWTGGADKIYPSFRSYLVEMTMGLERGVAVGYQEKKSE